MELGLALQHSPSFNLPSQFRKVWTFSQRAVTSDKFQPPPIQPSSALVEQPALILHFWASTTHPVDV